MMDSATLRRFLQYIGDYGSECWVWTGGITTHGYGQFSVDGKNLAAHRVAYEHFLGVIPSGLTVDHLCRNRACVNPAHLDAVTERENILRGVSPAAENARKTHCKRGHELEGRNAMSFPSQPGRRQCRQCRLERTQRWRRAQREAVPK